MAADEALLRLAKCPVARFYRWSSPALTYGYAQRFEAVRASAGGLPAVRRWTGGGMVFHGEDLTLALAVPAAHGFCRLQTGAIYREIHRALLGEIGKILPGARLAGPGDCVTGPACFASPALDDILHGGRKICGGALRRGKAGILYQGSLHGNFDPQPLARSLSASAAVFEPGPEPDALCARLAEEKYGTDGWNKMR